MAHRAGALAATSDNLSVIPGTQDSCKLPSNLDTLHTVALLPHSTNT